MAPLHRQPRANEPSRLYVRRPALRWLPRRIVFTVTALTGPAFSAHFGRERLQSVTLGFMARHPSVCSLQSGRRVQPDADLASLTRRAR